MATLKLITAFVLLIIAELALAKEHAVTAFEKQKGFQLSEAAKKRIGYLEQTLELKNNKLSVPTDAVVESESRAFAYRVREGWLERVPVDRLKPGDRVVVRGSAILRVTELELEEEGTP